MAIVDYDFLLDTDITKISRYFQQLLATQNETAINSELLEAIDAEIIPPITYSIWLPLTQNVSLVRDALIQDYSVLVRKVAIDRIGRLLTTSRWEEIWITFGGLKGFLHTLSILSVFEVRRLTQAIGHSYRYTTTAKTTAMTALLRALLPNIFPNEPISTQDQRPLTRDYVNLVPVCDDETLRMVIDCKATLGYDYLPSAICASHHRTMQDLYQQDSDRVTTMVKTLTTLWLPPCCTSGHPGQMTCPMKFSLKILQNYAASTNIAERSGEEMISLINSLVRRAIKRKPRELKEIIELSIGYYAANPKLIKIQSLGHRSFLSQLIHIWGKSVSEDSFVLISAVEAENLVVKMLQLLRNVDRVDINYEDVIPRAHKIIRYQLLRLVKLHFNDIDIDHIEQLDKFSSRSFPVSILRCINAQSAVPLLQRLLEANPAGELFPVQYLRSEYPAMSYSGAYIDNDVIFAHLQAGEDQTVQTALRKIRERKSLAEKSRDQPMRSYYAQTVLLWASLSGSLLVFADAGTWIQRFLRDSFTIKELYSASVLNTKQIVWLLSGANNRNQETFCQSELLQIRTTVREANSILRLLFTTVIEAVQHEPSFSANYGQGLIDLLSSIVVERTRIATQLEEQPDFLKDQIYDAVWSDTLILVLEIEKQTLKIDFEALRPHNGRDVLSRNLRTLQTSSKTTLRFYDTLAQERDKLWQHHRFMEKSACGSIPEPFPTGLPIQCFIHGDMNLGGWLPEYAPYVAGRCKNVAFMAIRNALAPIPTDTELLEAIGSLVDSVHIAVQIYVLQDSQPEKRRDRLKEVWSYWIKLLTSHNNMTKRNAIEFLKNHIGKFEFDRCLDELLGAPETIPWPVRPMNYDASEILEWNPAAKATDLKSKQEFPAKTLNCGMLATSQPSLIPGDSLSRIRAWEVIHHGESALQVDNMIRYGKFVSGNLAEGLLLTALLIIDSDKDNSRRYITSTYPPKKHIRYPAVYLDADFLERDDASVNAAFHALEELKDYMPSRLLAGMINARHNVNESSARRLLQLLSQSDKPYLAIPMIFGQILGDPDGSAWSRSLLGADFLRRISPDIVEQSFIDFANAIIQKMKLQATRPKAAEGVVQAPIIKVTTVKQLAQMLRECEFIAPSIAVNILHRLLQNTNHIDIKVEAVSALLYYLPTVDGAVSDILIEATLSAIELAVPSISALNERYPLTEEQWQALEASDQMPELVTGNGREIQPIMSKLLNLNLPRSIAKELTARIILPAMESSVKNNKRALSMVLRKCDVPDSFVSGIIPFNFNICVKLLGPYCEFLPQSLIGKFHEFAMLKLQPPEWHEMVANKLKSTISMNNSAEAQCWRAFLSQSTGHEIIRCIIELLTKDFTEQNTYKPDIKLFQGYICEYGTALIKNADSSWSSFEGLLKPTLTPGDFADTISPKWLQNIAPIVTALATYIDDLRNLQWQRNPKRKPSSLPSTLRLHSWLLPMPITKDGSFTPDQLSTYAQTIFTFTITSFNPRHHVPSVLTTLMMDLTRNIRHEYRVVLLVYLGGMALDSFEVDGQSVLTLLMLQSIVPELKSLAFTHRRALQEDKRFEVFRQVEDARVSREEYGDSTTKPEVKTVSEEFLERLRNCELEVIRELH